MKQTPLKRKTELRRTAPLKRTELRPTEDAGARPSGAESAERASRTGRAKGRGIRRPTFTPASPAQRSKVRELGFCIVTGFQPDLDSHGLDPAHLCPRSHGGCDDELCVVPLHRPVHRKFDDGKFDLLPYLVGRYALEIQHALGHYDGDLISLLNRLTGQRWEAKS